MSNDSNGGISNPYVPFDGAPTSPAYVSGLTGPAFTAERDLALTPGASVWSMLARAQAAKAAADERDTGVSQIAGNTANAESNLAMQGGLSSGARERVQETGQKNFMNMAQAANRTNDNANLQIGVDDAQNKLKTLSDVTGKEMTENQNINQFNQGSYQAQLQALAADKQAQATENSHGKK